MKKKSLNNQKEVNSLAELTMVPCPQLPALEIEEVSGESIAVLEKQAEETRRNAREVSKFVKNALAFREQIWKLSREARECREEKLKSVEAALNNLLYKEAKPAYRRAAWREVFACRLKREINSGEEARTIFAGLVGEGFLQENPDGKGHIQWNGFSYSVPERSAFEEPEFSELAGMVEILTSKVRTAQKTRRREETAELFASSTLSFQEFKARKPGKIALVVPAEEIPSREGNGQKHWLSGGVILVESDESSIHPIRWVGGEGFSYAVREVQDLGIFLFLDDLDKEEPPYKPKLDPLRGRKFKLFWHLCKRAVLYAEEEEKVTAQEARLQKSATVGQEEFFLDQASGIVCAEFKGLWRTGGTEDENIPNLFCLIERAKEEDGSTSVTLLDVPDHIREFLGGQIGQSYQEGERFEGVPYPFRAVLQAIWRQTKMAAEIADSGEKSQD